jgi:hypothetical protein
MMMIFPLFLIIIFIFGAAPVIVAGGHSLYFRNFFKTFLPQKLDHPSKVFENTNMNYIINNNTSKNSNNNKSNNSNNSNNNNNNNNNSLNNNNNA